MHKPSRLFRTSLFFFLSIIFLRSTLASQVIEELDYSKRNILDNQAAQALRNVKIMSVNELVKDIKDKDNLNKIKTLNLSNNYIEKAGIKIIAEEIIEPYLPALEELNLSNNLGINLEAVYHLENLLINRNTFKHLVLLHTGVSTLQDIDEYIRYLGNKAPNTIQEIEKKIIWVPEGWLGNATKYLTVERLEAHRQYYSLIKARLSNQKPVDPAEEFLNLSLEENTKQEIKSLYEKWKDVSQAVQERGEAANAIGYKLYSINIKESFLWFKRGAELNHRSSLYNVFHMLRCGIGTLPNSQSEQNMWNLFSKNPIWQESLDKIIRQAPNALQELKKVKGLILHMHSSRPICEPCALVTFLELNSKNSFAQTALDYCNSKNIPVSEFLITYSCRQENTKSVRYTLGHDNDYKNDTDFNQLVNSSLFIQMLIKPKKIFPNNKKLKSPAELVQES